MLDIFQKTLSQKVCFKGKGLHSGKNSTIKLFPAKENTGIVFERVDLREKNLIVASQLHFPYII